MFSEMGRCEYLAGELRESNHALTQLGVFFVFQHLVYQALCGFIFVVVNKLTCISSLLSCTKYLHRTHSGIAEFYFEHIPVTLLTG